jgi:hypothetical protein
MEGQHAPRIRTEFPLHTVITDWLIIPLLNLAAVHKCGPCLLLLIGLLTLTTGLHKRGFQILPFVGWLDLASGGDERKCTSFEVSHAQCVLWIARGRLICFFLPSYQLT